MRPPAGLIIAAPASGSGKTLVTLGLLRHLRDTHGAVASAKVGPDYIDPKFHEAAGEHPCVNLDLWAMRPETLAGNLSLSTTGAELIICEGVMGLFDGARLDEGSTADVAAQFGWPVILVVDAGAQGASAAAVVRGFAQHRSDVDIAGVIFNRVGSPRHQEILIAAMNAALPDIPIVGCLPRLDELALPDRHLGLVQAREHGDLEEFLDRAAKAVATHLDIEAVHGLARPSNNDTALSAVPPVAPLGQRIAVARDDAFSFTYPHIIEGWRNSGSEIVWFSPLAGEAPDKDADAIYLPGGYPELHAGTIADNANFRDVLQDAAEAGKILYGECGGYMVLGHGLVDRDGDRHAMAGLLPLETSFAERRLHLGYRRARNLSESPLGKTGAVLRGHEFHYASVLDEGAGDPLFNISGVDGNDLGTAGRRCGTVMGSFIHLIDREDSSA